MRRFLLLGLGLAGCQLVTDFDGYHPRGNPGIAGCGGLDCGSGVGGAAGMAAGAPSSNAGAPVAGSADGGAAGESGAGGVARGGARGRAGEPNHGGAVGAGARSSGGGSAGASGSNPGGAAGRGTGGDATGGVGGSEQQGAAAGDLGRAGSAAAAGAPDGEAGQAGAGGIGSLVPGEVCNTDADCASNACGGGRCCVEACASPCTGCSESGACDVVLPDAPECPAVECPDLLECHGLAIDRTCRSDGTCATEEDCLTWYYLPARTACAGEAMWCDRGGECVGRTVGCGLETCSLPSSYCEYDWSMNTSSCVDAATAKFDMTSIWCNSTDECPLGQVCCLTVTSDGAQAACAKGCLVDQDEVLGIVCTGDNHCDGACIQNAGGLLSADHGLCE